MACVECRDRSVLYLEDEVLIALDVSHYLGEVGFGEISVTHRLRDAWSAIDDRTFDLALLDINVDKQQTSIELGERLLSDGTPVIFISGSGAEREPLEGRGFRFVNKPFSHQALEHQIIAALEVST